MEKEPSPYIGKDETMTQTADRAIRLREEVYERIDEIQKLLKPIDAVELEAKDLLRAFGAIQGAAHDAKECCLELEALSSHGRMDIVLTENAKILAETIGGMYAQAAASQGDLLFEILRDGEHSDAAQALKALSEDTGRVFCKTLPQAFLDFRRQLVHRVYERVKAGEGGLVIDEDGYIAKG